jgi:hypothetical protein
MAAATRQRQPVRARAQIRNKDPMAATRAIPDMSSTSTIRFSKEAERPHPSRLQDRMKRV